MSRYFPWAVAAALAIILTVVLLARHPVSPPVAPGLVLRIEDAGPAVEIAWDPDAEAVRAASHGEILLQDGSQASQMTLDATQLRQGRVRRPRKTNDVQARMKLYLVPSGEMQEFARLFIKTVGAPAATPVPDPLEAEVERLNQQLHQERAISDRLKQTVKILENTIAVDSARKEAK